MIVSARRRTIVCRDVSPGSRVSGHIISRNNSALENTALERSCCALLRGGHLLFCDAAAARESRRIAALDRGRTIDIFAADHRRRHRRAGKPRAVVSYWCISLPPGANHAARNYWRSVAWLRVPAATCRGWRLRSPTRISACSVSLQRRQSISRSCSIGPRRRQGVERCEPADHFRPRCRSASAVRGGIRLRLGHYRSQKTHERVRDSCGRAAFNQRCQIDRGD